MKKVFLATSFSGKVDEHTGRVLPEFRTFIEQLLKGLRTDGAEVFAAIEYEGWMVTPNVAPEVGVRKDLDEIDNADVLVALVHDKPSVGVQFELGYAVGKGKQVILVRHADEPLAYFNQGIISDGLITLVEYDNASALIPQLTVAINAPEK